MATEFDKELEIIAVKSLAVTDGTTNGQQTFVALVASLSDCRPDTILVRKLRCCQSRNRHQSDAQSSY